MTIAAIQPTNIEEFLQLPETEPASEFIHGQIIQKPMPQGEHSQLQIDLCETINQITKPQKIAKAFPELRCIFGGLAIVPDIAVFRWERIPRLPSGRIANRFELHPDWVIEILSPEQKYKQVLSKLLHCAEYGTELGWLVDSDDESILVVDSDRRVKELKNSDYLPVLTGIELNITVQEVFSWLSL
ncbi:Uma2 family endonuclease [Sphaerospermopsis sp. LEGE 08334]|jgi:Uma2 family endonuclease|uniref:Uma2 family endonuclease n=1 Tax=Sphaerospermopsis sp. LEGE 08334 TaxID=1828651 RepID=UPI0018816AEB|nr:Uma2 family endonuclease [Sphaerospermopsis sp. LEGE 08334]MBE9058589.1 Uma2 family endonuclease [Sphaerospermopsis sp. LEGE 08334]